MASINVKLFASVRELAGVATVSVTAPPGFTVGMLRDELARSWPDLSPLLQKSAIAVNRRYAKDDQAVTAHDEVAVIPPVAGG